jgi:hypothetical protein
MILVCLSLLCSADLSFWLHVVSEKRFAIRCRHVTRKAVPVLHVRWGEIHHSAGVESWERGRKGGVVWG